MSIRRAFFVQPATSIKLDKAQRLLGITSSRNRNGRGRFLDRCIDAILAYAESQGQQPMFGLGSLDSEQVRAIRKSKEKIIFLSVTYGVSQGHIERIRAKRVYKWVK